MKKEETKSKNTKKGTSTKGNLEKKDVSKRESNKVVKEDKEKIVIKEVTEEKIVEEVTNNKVKKQPKSSIIGDILLVLGLVVVVVLGFFVIKGSDPLYELPLTLSGEPGLYRLTYAEYQEKIDNGEHFVVILERATCPHCVTYLPVAEKFATDYKVPMYYVDTDTFSTEDWESFEKSNSYLKKANGNWGTPTTMVLAGNVTVSYIEGATDAGRLKTLYNEYFDAKL